MTTYAVYNSPSDIKSLDINYFDLNKVDEFPRHLYTGDITNTAYYLCPNMPRDKDINYIIDVERDQHPDHFSRFAYGNNRNGYGFGLMVGRYQVAENCREDPQPKDTAPRRFYRDPYMDKYGEPYVRPQVYIDSLKTRGGVTLKRP